ncbi:hypothetical protein ACTI_10890 [Actinoplanes sp. OR16]|uniref:cell wall anchor protein n=1 Tax=Actinoplanes sp. OR16 TaxID=946334 RepID=UPI000F70FB6C|nr:cell wall anchor protein [Actinoplanes sp. OR16]BBH64404.1 hypothetical protein ACTI_10890 [Actinoplanes sp. OR16]
MRNTPLRRAALVAAGALLGLTGLVGVASPASADEITPPVTAEAATFVHTFEIKDGKAFATVTPDADLQVPEEVTLVSYFAPQPKFATPQYAFQYRTGKLEKKGGVVSLEVEVPDCNTQVDLFFGGEDDVLDTIDGEKRYGNLKLGESGFPGKRSSGPAGWFNGGNKNCVQPVVQPVPQCDGTVDLQLSNNGALSKYDVEFLVKGTGFEKTVKVAAGKGDTVEVPAGAGTITVSAEGMKDFTYTWSRPETCTPTAGAVNDCTDVIVTVTNPEGNAPAKADVTYGSETKSTTVAPGASEQVTFPAGEATTATVTYPEIPGTEPVTVEVTKTECPEPSTPASEQPSTPASEEPSTPASEEPSATPSESASTSSTPIATTPVSDDEPSLPVTGAAAGGIAGGAAVLVAVGAGLFLMARRRKLNFKA